MRQRQICFLFWFPETFIQAKQDGPVPCMRAESTCPVRVPDFRESFSESCGGVAKDRKSRESCGDICLRKMNLDVIGKMFLNLEERNRGRKRTGRQADKHATLTNNPQLL